MDQLGLLSDSNCIIAPSQPSAGGKRRIKRQLRRSTRLNKAHLDTDSNVSVIPDTQHLTQVKKSKTKQPKKSTAHVDTQPLGDADKFTSTGARPKNVAATGKIRAPPAKGHKKQKKLHQSKEITLYCLETGCKHNRQSTQEMVQCSHCAIWHHLDCVDLHRSESIGVWPCPRCRCQTDILQQCQRALQDVSSQVVALQLLQDEVHKGLAKLMHVKTLEQSNLDLVKLIGSKIGECDDLKAKNAELELQLSNSDKANSIPKIKALNPKRRPISETLLIGDSIIRDFINTDPAKTSVRSLPGGHINDVKKSLKQPENVYKDIVLHVGSNDCSDSVDVKAILGQYNELIDLAATAVTDTGTVRVRSVCPRSNPETQARIDTFNGGLSELCQSRNVQFIDNDDNFKTRNGSSNYALIAKDRIHLNASGTAVLAKNLDINIQFKKDNSKKKQAVNNNATQVNRSPSFQPNQGKVRKSHKQINDDKLKQPKKHVQNNKKYQQQVADQPKTLIKQPLCDFCGVTGHMSKVCRFGSVVTCYPCVAKRNIRRIDAQTNRNPAKMSVPEKTALTLHP